MQRPTVIITGAAGFIGSALTVELRRDFAIYALDAREPAGPLRQATPGVQWARVDIGRAEEVAAAFERARTTLGRVNFVVHLAAYYHFDVDPRPEYESTNVQGTRYIVEAAASAGAARIFFASSLLAMEPAPPNERLTEQDPANGKIPYAVSKAVGERILAENSSRLPAAILRVGGAFSDWCELPPLYNLMKLWGTRGPMGRVLAGQGRTGFPFIHRRDLVRLFRKALERNAKLGRLETLLASTEGAVTHRELFPLFKGPQVRPLSVPIWLASIGLRGRCALGALTGNPPFERPWMLEYVDRPYVAENAYTRRMLDWEPTPALHIKERFPILLEKFVRERNTWEARNQRRNAAQYEYAAD